MILWALLHPITFLLGLIALSSIVSFMLYRCIGIADAIPCILFLAFVAVVFW